MSVCLQSVSFNFRSHSSKVIVFITLLLCSELVSFLQLLFFVSLVAYTSFLFYYVKLAECYF